MSSVDRTEEYEEMRARKVFIFFNIHKSSTHKHNMLFCSKPHTKTKNKYIKHIKKTLRC